MVSVHDRILNCCFLRSLAPVIPLYTYYLLDPNYGISTSLHLYIEHWTCMHCIHYVVINGISTWQNIELLLSSVSRTCNIIIYVLPTRSELWYQYITTPVHWTLNLHALHTLVINMFVTVVHDTTASRRSIVYMTEYTTYITSASRSTHRIQYVTYSKLCSTGSLER
jgi:hypothetical protein